MNGNDQPTLTYRERPADGEAAGLLVLHHGRGSDENDLIGLADLLDPARKLHVVSARAPLALSGWPGYHWYVSGQVGYPDRDSFMASRAMLGAFHDRLQERTGVTPERTVLGGFSMGAVMSYTLGLSGDRPAPAGILALSGFIPTVEGWEPDLASRTDLPVMIAHGRHDPVISFEFAERARETLTAAGLPVTWQPTDGVHGIDPPTVETARRWLDTRVAAWSGVAS